MPPSASPPTSKPIRTHNSTLIRLLNYTVFTFLAVILLCLILLTPADAIYQCYVTHRLTNIFIITGGYVVTFLLAALIYATRIYTNRTVLGGIPKAWIPVEKEDVGKSVRRLVVEGLGRSALVAWGARPREVRARGYSHPHSQAQSLANAGRNDDGEREGLLRGFDFDVDPANPPWGIIEHPGWSAPESSLSASAPITAGMIAGDTQPPPGLCYRTVIRELPHLIEAKAVSLAPPDPVVFAIPPSNQNLHHQTHPEDKYDDWASSEEEEGRGIPDTRIVAILRRPPTMSLRDYIQHLTKLSIIDPPETGAEFLSLYERARFSGNDLYEDEFRALMGVFADVLRGMRFSLDHHRHHHHFLDTDTHSMFGSRSESVIGPSDEEGETETNTLGSVNFNSLSRPSTRSHPRSRYEYEYHYANRPENPDSARSSGAAPGTAAARGRSRTGGNGIQSPWPRTPSPSAQSHYSHSLRPVRSNGSGPPGLGPGSAGATTSLRSASRSGSGSGASVIRLADARTESVSGLPYVIGSRLVD